MSEKVVLDFDFKGIRKKLALKREESPSPYRHLHRSMLPDAPVYYGPSALQEKLAHKRAGNRAQEILENLLKQS